MSFEGILHKVQHINEMRNFVRTAIFRSDIEVDDFYAILRP